MRGKENERSGRQEKEENDIRNAIEKKFEKGGRCVKKNRQNE